MSKVGQIERITQDRVIKLFVERLGYEYGGNREDVDNRNIDEDLLRQNLKARGYDEVIIKRALHELKTTAAVSSAPKLYEANRAVYDLLRYGVKVKRSASENFETVC